MSFSISNTTLESQVDSKTKIYPVVALREGVVFPHTEAHLTFGRPKSAAAIEAAVKGDKEIIFVAQKTSTQTPELSDLYETGTLCIVEQVAPYGTELLALVKGISRVKILKYTKTEPYLTAQIEVISEQITENDSATAIGRQIITEFKNAFNLGKSVEFPVFMRLMAGVSASELSDQVANSLDLTTSVKQELLECFQTEERLDKVLGYLVHEIKVLELEKSISSKTHAKFERNMKEQILRERQKTIKDELTKMGAESEGDDDDLTKLKKAISEAKMPEQVRIKAEKELARLNQMSPNNPESNYVRSYLDWLVEMPWGVSSTGQITIDAAGQILDTDHYGLKKAKDRILEFLAVMQLKAKKMSNTQTPNVEMANGKFTDQSVTDDIPATILCFVGPPGVGKTSIGKSIAKALGRKFVRISLGGIRDEAEIRGHRRTYVGALPGRIIQGMKQAKTNNPVFMLDEIDKIGTDFRGDPSSALLEALDPQQNREFTDHYLDVPYDLSQVMFIATANMLDTIPAALRDRLEIIRFPGYTLEEKQHIAKNYVWPRQVNANAIPEEFKISDTAINELIKRYTREAGVRDLERQMAKICRKIARIISEGKTIDFNLSIESVKTFLGAERHPETLAESEDQIGVSTGMAYTEAGGDILFIEVAIMPGKGELKLTGQLGDVMKESAHAAFSYVRSKWDQLGLKSDFYKSIDIHIHVPEGAVPKDGPSAGLAIATALISALTKTPTRREVAMTGEITLRGRASEIGGVKEKVIAAHRAGIKEVILPKENEKDFIEDVPESVKRDIKFHFVSHIDDVLGIVFRKPFVFNTSKSPKSSNARQITAVA